MQIVIQNREGKILTYPAYVGQKLTGLRLEQVIFETSQDIQKLSTKEGQRWLEEHLALAMRHIK